jgi:hypothetical protein
VGEALYSDWPADGGVGTGNWGGHQDNARHHRGSSGPRSRHGVRRSPTYCRAQGVLDRRIGVDGKAFAIGFAIALPDRWNGRFLFRAAA